MSTSRSKTSCRYGPPDPNEKKPPAARLHLVAQLVVRDVLVADERDAPDRDRLVLGDLELDDDLVVPLRLDDVKSTSARK